jgi:Na+/H+-dicarboxylate symporter
VVRLALLDLNQEADNVIWDLMVLAVVPILTLAMYLAQAHHRGWEQMLHLAPIYFVLAACCVAFVVYKLIRRSERLSAPVTYSHIRDNEPGQHRRHQLWAAAELSG